MPSINTAALTTAAAAPAAPPVGQPSRLSHSKQRLWPAASAALDTVADHGQPCSLSHFRASSLPPAAALTKACSLRGHPWERERVRKEKKIKCAGDTYLVEREPLQNLESPGVVADGLLVARAALPPEKLEDFQVAVGGGLHARVGVPLHALGLPQPLARSRRKGQGLQVRGGDFRLRLRPHLDHVQVAPRSGVEQDFVGEPRAGRVLLPAPLEGLEVAALARAVAGVLVPRALGVLRPRPLQDLQREEGRGGRPENFVSAPAVLIRGNASAAALTSRWPCQAAAAQVSLSQGHLGSCDLAHCRISSDPVAAA